LLPWKAKHPATFFPLNFFSSLQIEHIMWHQLHFSPKLLFIITRLTTQKQHKSYNVKPNYASQKKKK
jgi:hypothetical protein